MEIQCREVFIAIFFTGAFTIFLAGAAPIYATSSGNCTPTNCNLHNVTIDMGPIGTNPCNGQPASADAFVTGNLATHGSSDGTHVTMTMVGDLTFTQDNGVSYSGHLTDWFGGNLNKGGAAEFSGTTNAHVTGSDGTSFHLHAAMHIIMTPSGDITANVNNLNCH